MKNILLIGLFAVSVLLAACGSSGSTSNDTGKVIKSAPLNNLTVTLSNKDGVLKHGDEEVMLTFTDASGKPVEVGAVALTFGMQAMGAMAAMHDNASFTTTVTPGVYRGKVKIEMAGEWQATITYDGAAGRGQTSFPITVR